MQSEAIVMKEKTGILPIITIILRYIATAVCIAIGIFISTGGTNSMVGATMAFVCAIMICPLLDTVMKLMNLHYETSLKALVVIIMVIVDIIFSKSTYWFWINIGVSLVLIILFGFLSNIKKVIKPSFDDDDDDDEEEEDQYIEQPRYSNYVSKKEVVEPKKEKQLLEKLSIFEEEEPVRSPKKIESLNSPELCYEYIMNHGYGQGFDEWVIKDNMALVLAALAPNEKILFCFMGNHQYKSEFDHLGAFGYALTNRRLIFARKGENGQTIQAMALPKMERVTLKKGLVDSVMTVETAKATVAIGMDNDSCRKIAARIHRFIEEIKRLKERQHIQH
jgi:hypothetical protein